MNFLAKHRIKKIPYVFDRLGDLEKRIKYVVQKRKFLFFWKDLYKTKDLMLAKKVAKAIDDLPKEEIIDINSIKK